MGESKDPGQNTTKRGSDVGGMMPRSHRSYCVATSIDSPI